MKLLLAVAAVVAVATSATLEENSRIFTKSASDFNVKFLTELTKAKPQRSLVFSSYSLIPLLLELSMGAEGESKDQMQRPFGNDEFIRSVFPYALDELTAIKDVTLNMAFANFIADGYKIKKEFDTIAKEHFRSALSPVNFANNVDAANTINSWVENKTNHKIKDLVSSDSLDGFTRLVMCNAIYFKGEWETKFNKELTRDRDFHKSSKEKVSIPTMYTEAKFKYAKSNKLKAQILELPYRGGEVSMVIVLPDEIDGLQDVITALKEPNLLADEMQNMYEDKVNVQVPKFKIETEIDLKEILIKLGIDKIFDEANANLVNLIETNEKLYVSKAKQKAVIEVNEEGAEAAAANVFVVKTRSGRRKTTFTADHPFVYFIQNNKVPLFTGTYVQ